MRVLGQVNIDAFNFSSVDLSKQSLLKSSANECQANPQKTVDDVNKQTDFFIFRWDLPCSTFIFPEQPSIMAMAEVNRPLITLDYYGSKSCQSRLKTNTAFFVFAKVKNVVQKQNRVVQRVSPSRFTFSGRAQCVACNTIT